MVRVLKTQSVQSIGYILDQMIHDIIKKLQTLDLQGFEAVLNRARDRNRTGTVSLQQDFKSCASASSATRAYTLYTGTLRVPP